MCVALSVCENYGRWQRHRVHCRGQLSDNIQQTNAPCHSGVSGAARHADGGVLKRTLLVVRCSVPP